MNKRYGIAGQTVTITAGQHKGETGTIVEAHPAWSEVDVRTASGQVIIVKRSSVTL